MPVAGVDTRAVANRDVACFARVVQALPGGAMEVPKTTYHGGAYGVEVQVEREGAETSSVYEAAAFTELYTFVRCSPAEEITTPYDVSSTMRKFFGD